MVIQQCSFKGKVIQSTMRKKKKWLQTWVDNNGGYLDLEGEFVDSKMTLARRITTPKGEK